MSKLKFKHSLAILKSENQIVNLILKGVREQFQGIDLEALKNDPQLVYDICNCVENTFTKKKLNKKHIVLKVFTELFQDCDIDRVDRDIETAFNNGLIVKDTLLVRILKVLVNMFFKR